MKPRAPILSTLALVLAAGCPGGGSVLDVVTPSRGECDRPDNLVTNCGFDSDIDGWLIYTGESWAHVPNDGSSKLGSLELASWALAGTDAESVWIQQCVAVPPVLRSYDFGMQVKLVSGTVDNCAVTVSQSHERDCGGQPDIPIGVAIVPGADWTPAPKTTTRIVSTAGLRGLLISVVCGKRDGPEFTVRFDDFYLIEADEPPS